jgi:glycosyltransferase involved in cell wall biosynthesis
MTNRKVLFLQVTNPGAYPPLIHAGSILAEQGWDVTYLTSPSRQSDLTLPQHPNIVEERTTTRKDFTVSAFQFFEYCWRSILLAKRLKGTAIYASDPIGAAPALLAKILTNGHLIYHEHDSPDHQGDLHPVIRIARKLILKFADLVIFPNSARAEATRQEIPFPPEKLKIVWNVPRLEEICATKELKKKSFAFGLYFHGSIGPDKLPHTIIPTIVKFGGDLSLTLVGYETASGVGYVKELQNQLIGTAAEGCIIHSGPMSRDALLAQDQLPQIGLALMPKSDANINSTHMAGASNKVFDYMSMGIIPIVSDSADWNDAFVASGFALAADPECVDSLYRVIDLLRGNPKLIEAMRKRAHAKIMSDWNYDHIFLKSVLSKLEE